MPETLEGYKTPEDGGKVSLRDILVYDNPRQEEYREIIEEELKSSNRRYLPESISEGWVDVYFNRLEDDIYNPPRYAKLREYLTDKLNSGILIDVGGGGGEYIAELAKKSGVSKYINVDLYSKRNSTDPFNGKIINRNYRRLSDEEKVRQMDDIQVDSDMLDFVSRLPDNCANFAVNGIDTYVIDSNKYRDVLFNEIVRATKVGGIIFGIESNVCKPDSRLQSYAEEYDLDTEHWGNRHFLFEKLS